MNAIMKPPTRAVLIAVAGLLAAASCGDPTSPTPDPAAPDSVGVAGGTASTSDGAARLTVPAGALQQAAAIKIEPAAVSDLAARVPPSEYDPDLGAVYGVVPIPGTIWDLQPDGLQFQTPATIVLRYDESALPEGVSEDDLGVFVINGIFEQLPATVDRATNTITAQISHFSFAFTGPTPPPRLDLEVASLSASSDPVQGQPMEVTAEVRNNGPGGATGASVLYEVVGTVALGELDAACSEVVASEFGDLAISCALPPMPVDALESSAPVRFIPQQAGETVTVRATVAPVAGATELDPENDTRELEIVIGGEGATIDLKAAQPGLSPESDPRVGGLIGFVGRVDNLGAGTSNPATMLFEAFGDVVLGDVPSVCTEIDPIDPVTAAMECPVDPLEQYDLDLIGPFRLTAQSEGEIRVETTVTPAAQDTDVNAENNFASLTIEVGSTYLVDLEPVATPKIEGIREPGEPLTFQIRIGNYRPPSNGGRVIYDASGDVAAGELAEGCTAAPEVSDVAVSCAFDPFVGYVNDTRAPGGGRVLGWVGPFEVIPQSNTLITFSATTEPVEGDTDVNPDNDRLEKTLAIGTRSTDLELVSLTAPDAPDVDEAFEAVVAIQNLGPDDSRGLFLTFSAYGDVELGDFGDSCVEVPTGGEGFPGVGLRCELAPLLAMSGRNIAFQIIPRSEGTVSMNAGVQPLLSEDRDPVATNNSASTNVTVGSGG